VRLVIVYFLLAEALWLSACTTTTEVNGKQVANADPAPADGDPKRRVAIRLQLASNYYQQRNYNVALEELGRVLQIEPDNAAAHGLRGLIYLDLDDRAQAEASFSRAITLTPDNAELNNNYGWFLCRTGREREAIVYFQKAGATQLYQTPALAYRNAGICLMQVRDYSAAEQNLKRAFELDAADLTTKFHLTRAYIALRQIERARFYHGLFEKELGETSETIWLSMRIARASGDVRSERQFADELRRRYPNSAETAALGRGAFDE
jgi:type IV pilus assembly protein PilF